MAAVTMSLGSGDQTESDVEDMISSEIKRNGKQANVSIFAFTATPSCRRYILLHDHSSGRFI